jgi:UDP-glucose 4-epimerase
MRAAVFGGSGFLGSHLADALSEAGHEVVIFDKVASPYRRPGQDMAVGDILDADAVDAALEDCQVAYNLAGIADLDDCLTKPASTVTLNVLGNVRVMDGCVRRGVGRFVHASTIYVNSAKGGFYRCSKQAAETYVEEYHQHYGLEYRILRYGTLYGPRADARNSIYRYLRQALDGGDIVVGASGEEKREYIYVADAARLSVEALDPQYANARLNITGHQQMRFLDLLELIQEMFGGKVTITLTEARNPAHYTSTPYSFQRKPCHKLTSPCFVDLGQGLLECVNDMLGRAESGDDVPQAAP